MPASKRDRGDAHLVGVPDKIELSYCRESVITTRERQNTSTQKLPEV